MGRSDTGLQQPVGQTTPTVSPTTPTVTQPAGSVTSATSPITPTTTTAPVTANRPASQTVPLVGQFPPPDVARKLSLRDAWARMSPFAQQWLGRLGNSRG